MLAEEMFILQELRRILCLGQQMTGQQRHFGHFFQHNSVIDCLGRVFAPDEGAMMGAQSGGHMDRIQLPVPESLHNHIAGVFLIIPFHFLRCQIPAAGDASPKIIRVGGAEAGDIQTGLCPGGGIGAVGVDNATQSGEGSVERQVGGRIRGGIQFALNPIALKIHYHKIFGG